MAVSDAKAESAEQKRVETSENSVQEPSAEVAELSHVWIEDSVQESTGEDAGAPSDSPRNGVIVGRDGRGTTDRFEQIDLHNTDSDGSIVTTGSMLRTSPEGSPASPRSSSPVVKRVHFLDSFDDTDSDGLPAVRADRNYRKADTQWHDKDNRVKPLKSALKESENIFMLQETGVIDEQSGANADEESNIGHVAAAQTPINRSSRSQTAFPPAPLSKGDYRRSPGCQWGCCCAFGWLMIGAVALSAGAVLVAYMKGYWLAEQHSFERSLLYFGAALCAVGGVSLLVGLGFFTCVTLIWNPKRTKSEDQDPTVDSTKSKYVINNDGMGFEAVSGKGIQHSSGPSDVTIIDRNTGYVPCVEYTESLHSLTSRGHI